MAADQDTSNEENKAPQNLPSDPAIPIPDTMNDMASELGGAVNAPAADTQYSFIVDAPLASVIDQVPVEIEEFALPTPSVSANKLDLLSNTSSTDED